MRQRPGIGTIANVFLIGMWADLSLWLIPDAASPLPAWTMLLAGVFLNGVATGAYIGAGLGPGPRDGLMTGLVKRTGGSVRVIRTGIEVAVLAVGWLLGGTVGIGTRALRDCHRPDHPPDAADLFHPRTRRATGTDHGCLLPVT